MPLFTTKPTDQFFERFMKHQPNYRLDTPEADCIQAELDAEKEKKGQCPMIYRDDRHQHTFEKEAAMRPESISRALLAALYLLTADSKYPTHGNRGPGAALHEVLHDSLHRPGHPSLRCRAGQPDSI